MQIKDDQQDISHLSCHCANEMPEFCLHPVKHTWVQLGPTIVDTDVDSANFLLLCVPISSLLHPILTSSGIRLQTVSVRIL